MLCIPIVFDSSHASHEYDGALNDSSFSSNEEHELDNDLEQALEETQDFSAYRQLKMLILRWTQTCKLKQMNLLMGMRWSTQMMGWDFLIKRKVYFHVDCRNTLSILEEVKPNNKIV